MTVGGDPLSEAVVWPEQKVLSALSVQVYRTNVPITEGNIGSGEGRVP